MFWPMYILYKVNLVKSIMFVVVYFLFSGMPHIILYTLWEITMIYYPSYICTFKKPQKLIFGKYVKKGAD